MGGVWSKEIETRFNKVEEVIKLKCPSEVFRRSSYTGHHSKAN